MFERASEVQLLDEIANITSGTPRSQLVSNYFGGAMSGGDYLVSIHPGCVRFLERNPYKNIFYYYFIAKAGHLGDFDDELVDAPVASEQVFKGQLSEEILNHLLASGFVRYAQLRKMSMIRGENESIFENHEVQPCVQNDIDYIRSTIVTSFDPMSERPPHREKISTAVENKSIFKVDLGGELKGFYWAEIRGVVSELRYIYVSPDSRGGGLGRALLEHHLVSSKAQKKNQLWVLGENSRAISMYKSFGYSFEGLENLVFAKGIS